MPKIFAALFILCCALAVYAQPEQATASATRDAEKEKALWQELEKTAPKAIAPFKAGTEALDKGDYPTAAQHFEAARLLAPNNDAVLRRLGTALVESGNASKGTAMLERAYEKNPSADNMSRLAQYLAFPGGDQPSSKQQRQRALLLATQAARMDNSPYHQTIVAEIALSLDDHKTFRQAQEKMAREHPDLMLTHYFNAVRHALDGQWERAETEIKTAQSLGLPAAAAQQFLDSGVHTRVQVWRYLYLSLYLIAAWLIGLGLLFALGKIFSNRTLRSIEEADPNGAASQQESSLRTWYRRLINIAGVYYYLSLPVVVFLVIAVAGSIVYGFLMLGWLPIKLLLLLLIGAAITIYKMIRSLFIKIEREDPGRALREDEAPGLWALTREVAAALRTRPIDEIRVTPGCEVAVYEKGGFRQKMQDEARRILILGVGALNGLEQNALRAVLAHEYGHFSHRDTAGGDVALRVEQDMGKFAYAMALAGQAVWWNIAFQFLRVYHFIFRRLSYGATRLQEVLADRLAVRIYGAAAFEEGLRHVIRREVEFNHAASKEIQAAQSTGRTLSNLYHLPEPTGTPDEAEIEGAINDIVTRPTSEDDTHPSPLERFRLNSRVAGGQQLPTNAPVWDLFADRAALTAEMSQLIDERVKEAATA